jgi:hypothetical protein
MPSRPLRSFACIALALALSVALSAPSLAQEEAPPEVPQYGPPTQSTEVLGDISTDLRGIWVIVSHGGLPSNRVRNTVELYDIQGEGSALKLEYLVRKLPEDWQKGIDEANRAFKAWTPTDAQVAELARAVDHLDPGDANMFLEHKARVVAPSKYEEAEVTGPMPTDGSLFAIRVLHAYRPGPPKEAQAQLMKDEVLYVVQKAEPKHLEGDHSRIVLAAGFLPIPVVTQGPFLMYRLRAPGEVPPADSPLARFWDALTRGCK